MGSQHKKKKGNKDIRTVINDMKREQDQDANRTAMAPKFDIGYSPLGVSTMDFVHVFDIIDESNQTRTAPFNTATLKLWLKLNGNYRDYSNQTNEIYPHIAQKNKAFMQPGPRSASYGGNFNWPSRWADNALHDVAIDYLLSPDSTPIQLDFTTGFSYWCWIYPREIPGGTSWLLFVKTTDSTNYAEAFVSSNGGLVQVDFVVTEAGVSSKVKNNTATQPIALNAWSSIGCVYNGTAASIYTNKALGIASTGGTVVPSTTHLYIGGGDRGPIGANRGFKGGIAEFMYVKSLALTQTNINNLHDNGVY